jgi:hypothetical protein
VEDKELQKALTELVISAKLTGEENYVLRQAARILVNRKNNHPIYSATINMSEEVQVTLTAEFRWR